MVIKPVGFHDVQRALGTSECDEGSLCSHDNINMWAIYKPIITGASDTNKFDAVSYAERQEVNFGISDIPMWSRIDYMLSFLFGTRSSTNYPQVGNKPKYWTYRKPYGAGYREGTVYMPDTPFRISDFVNPVINGVGYYHTAERPFKDMENHEYTYNSSGIFRINYGCGAQNDWTIKLNQLQYSSQVSWGDMYFGVAMCQLDGNGGLTGTWYVCTQYARTDQDGVVTYTDYNMNQTPTMGFWVDIISVDNGGHQLSGMFKVFPIVCSQPYHFVGSQFGSNVKSICLLDPNEGGDDISIGMSIFQLDIERFQVYRVRGDNTYIYGSVEIINPNAVACLVVIQFTIYDINGNVIADGTMYPSTTIGSYASAIVDLKTLWRESAWDISWGGKNVILADTARVIVTPRGEIQNKVSSSSLCVVELKNEENPIQ